MKNKTYNVDKLKKAVGKWLFIDDEEWLDIILACALDRKLPGDPLWLFIIAVPSGSKTEILRALEEGENFFHLSSLTPNSLVSGYTFRDNKNKSRKVEDLASQINNKVLILKDFTSILSMAKEKRDEIIGQLREFYDGSYEKKFGNIDNKVRVESKFGLIAGVTPKVDQFHSIMGQLGERFLKLRSDFDDQKMLCKCDENEGSELVMRAELKRVFTEFIKNIEIKEVKFSKEHISKLMKISRLLVRLRAPSYERWKGDELVEYIPAEPEKPTRVYKQLKKLTKALCCIYQLEWPNEGILKRIVRVALDSSPPDRLKVYKYLYQNNNSSQVDIHTGTNIPKTSIQRILRFLKDVGLIGGVAPNDYSSEYWIEHEYTSLLNLWGQAPQNQPRYIVPHSVVEEVVENA